MSETKWTDLYEALDALLGAVSWRNAKGDMLPEAVAAYAALNKAAASRDDGSPQAPADSSVGD